MSKNTIIEEIESISLELITDCCNEFVYGAFALGVTYLLVFIK
jgi:hypothetical protein